jgi:hypothetical protein
VVPIMCDVEVILVQVQNSTASFVTGIRDALDQASALSLMEILVLQNSTIAVISSMSAAIARIFADSANQLSRFKSTTTFLLDDVYGDFLALSAESDAEQKKVLNATEFLVMDINENTKWAILFPRFSSVTLVQVLHRVCGSQVTSAKKKTTLQCAISSLI